MVRLLLPLFVLAGIVWLIARAVVDRSPLSTPVDRSAMVRQLFVGALLLVLIVLIAVGASDLGARLLDSRSGRDDVSDTADRARDLSFLIIGVPAYTLLLRYQLRRMVADQRRGVLEEQHSAGWFFYVNAAHMTMLVATMVTAHRAICGLFGTDTFEARDLYRVLVWAGLWAMHWFWLARRYKPSGDAYVALPSAAGLGTFAVGIGGVVARSAAAGYREAANGYEPMQPSPDLRSWTATAIVGGLCWGFYWLARYRNSHRTTLWHVVVVLLGGLGGLSAAVVAASIGLYRTLVWFIGDPYVASWEEHFTFLPAALAATVVGLASWGYHRIVLGRETAENRTDPGRVYDYLSAASGLVAAATGTALGVVALIEALIEPERGDAAVKNSWIVAATLLFVGIVAWRIFWRRIERAMVVARQAELASSVRTIYLTAVFGIGAIAALIGLIVVLSGTLQDLLDGNFGRQSIRDVRGGIGAVLAVVGIVWYHLHIFRRERPEVLALQGAVVEQRIRTIVIVSAHDPEQHSDLIDRLAQLPNSKVVVWRRTDPVPDPAADSDAIIEAVTNAGYGDVLVVVGPSDVRVTSVATVSS